MVSSTLVPTQTIKEAQVSKVIDPDCCPICGYRFDICKCDLPGSSHPYRAKRQKVVLEHLYLLTPKQLQWIVQLQKKWSMDYKDPELHNFFEELKREVILSDQI